MRGKRAVRGSARGLAMVAALVLAAGCGSGAAEPGAAGAGAVASGAPGVAGTLLPAEGEPLRAVTVAANSTSINHMWARWGIAHGFYERYGLDVEALDGVTDAVAAMGAGQLDFSAAGVSTQSGAVRGAPVRVVMVTFRDNLGVYGARDIGSVSELAGKRVFGPNDMVKEILKRHGIDPEDGVTWIQNRGNTRQSIELVEQGEADAFTGYPPAKLLAEQAGLHEIASVSEEFPGSPVSVVGTSEALMEEDPLVVKRFLAATLDTLEHLRESKDEVVEFFVTEWEFDEELAEESYAIVVRDMFEGGKTEEAALRQVLEVTRSAQGSTEDIPLDRVWDFSLLDEVLAEREAAGG